MQNAMKQATSVVCRRKSLILKYAVQIFVVTLLFFTGLCPAQTQFALAVGGRASDYGNSVAPTSDGGYVVTGETMSFGTGDYDLFLGKFNSSGDLTWAKTVGGTDRDEGNSVAPTSDGGYIVTGTTRSFGSGPSDLFLGKFSSSGGLTWAKTVGGVDLDWGKSVAQTFDGGYIVTGETESFGGGWYDLFLVKFNSSGDLTWAKTVGGALWDYGYSVAQTSDGGYIVTGETMSFCASFSDLFLAKFNSSGDLTWAKTVGGASLDGGHSVAQTPDGGYIVTGWTGSFGVGSYDLLLAKFNSSGGLAWAKTVGGADDDRGYSVAPTPDGGYIVTGFTWSFGAGIFDLFLGKFNSSGDLTWAKTVGGCGRDYGNSIAPTPDGGYIVTGMADGFGTGFDDLFLGKFSSSGEIEDCSFVADCSPVVGSLSLSSVSISPTIITLSLVAVSCSPTVTSLSPTVTNICPNFISETLTKPNSFELTVSPNPFNSSCVITISTIGVTLEIYDLQGRLIETPFTPTFGLGVSPKGGHENISGDEIVPYWGKMSEGQKGSYIWQPVESISSGVYLVRVTTNDGQQITRRIVYLR